MENEGTSAAVGGTPSVTSVIYDAFISYRRSDERTASAIYELLELFGQRVFFDRRCIRLGESWESSILVAARNTRTLLVLWSRSAAASSEMRRELQMVSSQCRVVPIRLDMSPLPPELSARQALDGLDVGTRILARGRELVVQNQLSQSEAMATLVRELQGEGIELTPAQQRRARVYIGSLQRSLWAAGLGAGIWLWSRASRAAVGPAGACAFSFGIAGIGAGHLMVNEPLPPSATERVASAVAPVFPVDDARLTLQRRLDESTRALTECQRDAKAALGECLESRQRTTDGARALQTCEGERTASLDRLKNRETALADAVRQLQECQASSRPRDTGILRTTVPERRLERSSVPPPSAGLR
jgi:hypothetical protein